MGSLMGGWNSLVLDPKSVKFKRNRSLTKQEIEAYWRSKRILEEEHLGAISMPVDRYTDTNTVGKDYKRSVSSPPATSTAEEEVCEESDMERKNLEKLKKNCWWTRSNSAFLNEPPVLDGAAAVASIKLNNRDEVGAWLH